MWNMKCFVMPLVGGGDRNCRQRDRSVDGHNIKLALDTLSAK
jgi:hypothetical protein